MFNEGDILEKVPSFNPKINLDLGPSLTSQVYEFLKNNSRFKCIRDRGDDCMDVFGLDTQTNSPIGLLNIRFRLYEVKKKLKISDLF